MVTAVRSGRFVTFEGGEGSGKSTQARLLAGALDRRGHACTVTREPGGTPGAEAIRGLLLDPGGPGWSPAAEALLFAAARSDHVERLIRPALAAGRWVICDRYLDSSRAYQGGAGGLGDEAVLTLHRIGSGALLPDATLLLEVDPGTAAARVAARDGADADRIGSREAAYFAHVGETFARLAADEPARVRRIDGSGSVEAVHARVLRALEPLIEDAAA